MTNLAMLADELRQFAGLVRAAGDDVGSASQQMGTAAADQLGSAALDSAALELQHETTSALDRIAAAAQELDHTLHRLAERSETLAGSR